MPQFFASPEEALSAQPSASPQFFASPEEALAARPAAPSAPPGPQQFFASPEAALAAQAAGAPAPEPTPAALTPLSSIYTPTTGAPGAESLGNIVAPPAPAAAEPPAFTDPMSGLPMAPLVNGPPAPLTDTGEGFFSGLAPGFRDTLRNYSRTFSGQAFTPDPEAPPQPKERTWLNQLGYGLGASPVVMGGGIAGGIAGRPSRSRRGDRRQRSRHGSARRGRGAGTVLPSRASARHVPRRGGELRGRQSGKHWLDHRGHRAPVCADTLQGLGRAAALPVVCRDAGGGRGYPHRGAGGDGRAVAERR